jgi:signal transduction histidine kinase
MTTATRLIVILSLVVAGIMAARGYFIVRQQETSLRTKMQDEVRAHALTLKIALETYYRSGRAPAAQLLIDRLSENTKLSGVVLFDEAGQVAMLSVPLVADEVGAPPDARRVIATGETVEALRRIGGHEVFSVMMPIETGGGRRGAFEIIQRTSSLEADIARARVNVAITTLIVCATIVLVVFVVTRRSLSRPIRELLAGAEAIGKGNLEYRVAVRPRDREFARLGAAFNRMADSLLEQRRSAARAAEERLALERELRHTERLALAGRLAAGVAHELGAPLNVIDGRAAQLLERPEPPPEMLQRNLSIVRAQARRITGLVRQLLDLARPHEIHRRPLEIAPLVANAVELLEADARYAGVRVEVAVDEHLAVVGDRDLLSQVLLNVFLNAVQAMPCGGRLRISSVADAGAEDGVRFAALRVSDTGTGIAPDDLALIFEPFYTTKEVGSGTGLGLAVSRRIVEQHGGRLEAENNPDGGATFTVFLPKPGPEVPGGLVTQRDRQVAYDESTTPGR